MTVNQAGSINVDFDGIPAHDQSLSVLTAGTYTFTAPTLAAGSYTVTAIFQSSAGGSTQATLPYTIETARPYVSGFTPSGTLNTAFSQAVATFMLRSISAPSTLPRLRSQAHPVRSPSALRSSFPAPAIASAFLSSPHKARIRWPLPTP